MRWLAEATAAILVALHPGPVTAAAVQTTAAPTTPSAATTAYPPTGLDEASGLALSALHAGVVWVVEDGGEFGGSSDALVEAFDTSGERVGSVQFEASDVFAGDNRDTEALAIGPGPTLWSADIGDNNAVRETVLVHSTPEPAELGDQVTTATSYRFTYPDGPRDAEAFLVDPVDGRAYIASKTVFGGAGWYAAPADLTPGETHQLTRVQDLPALLTDGAFSPDGSVVALRTLGLDGPSTATLYDVVRPADGAPVTLEERTDVALPAQHQGESVTFAADGSALLIGSEGPTEPIWSVPLPATTPSSGPGGSATGEPASTSAGATTTPSTGSAGPPSAQPAACGVRSPGQCLASESALLVALVVVLAGLLTAIWALRRRA